MDELLPELLENPIILYATTYWTTWSGLYFRIFRFADPVLHCFYQSRPPRSWALKLVMSPWFDRVTMAVILINCITLGKPWVLLWKKAKIGKACWSLLVFRYNWLKRRLLVWQNIRFIFSVLWIRIPFPELHRYRALNESSFERYADIENLDTKLSSFNATHILPFNC